MEENFKKRSTKKIIIIIAIVVLLVALIVGGVLFYLNSKNKPEKILEDKIKQAFELTESQSEEINSGRISLELSGEINSDMAEIKAINPIIKAVKINSITEFDVSKKIFNQNLSATYDGEQVISVDALLQDERVYVYLNELYSKYIDFTDELEEELSLEDIDLNSLFETNAELDMDALIKDIEGILIEEVSKLDLEQEKVEVNGEKVRKTTFELSEKDLLELLKKILNKVNEYQYNEEVQYLIEDLEYELEYVDEDSGNYIEISMYTKGLNNEIVKLEAKLFSYDEEEMSIEFNKENENKATIEVFMYDEEVMIIEYNKENDNKTTITAKAEGALFGIVIEKNSDTETVVNVLFNEYEESIETAQEVMSIVINEQNENEGTIKLSINAEEVELVLNVKYKVEENAIIEERNTTNSIKASEITDSDMIEILENVKKNEILYGIVNSMMSSYYDMSDNIIDSSADALEETYDAYEGELEQDFSSEAYITEENINYLDDYNY